MRDVGRGVSYRVASLLVLLCACTPAQPPRTAEAEVSEVEPEVAPEPPVEVAEAPPPPMPDDAVIELRRTRCYGTCPAYRVVIDARGHVSWEGEKFVRKEGKHAWDVAPEAVEPLWQGCGQKGAGQPGASVPA